MVERGKQKNSGVREGRRRGSVWWRKAVVVCSVGKEERAAQQQGGSDTRAVLDEWEMEKRAQCFEMEDGAAGVPRWSRFLQSIFVILGCGLELLGLLLVWKLLLHIHSPEPHGRDFWLTAPASRERRILGFPGLPTFPWGC